MVDRTLTMQTALGQNTMTLAQQFIPRHVPMSWNAISDEDTLTRWCAEACLLLMGSQDAMGVIEACIVEAVEHCNPEMARQWGTVLGWVNDFHSRMVSQPTTLH
jgi:hypothetical protein